MWLGKPYLHGGGGLDLQGLRVQGVRCLVEFEV